MLLAFVHRNPTPREIEQLRLLLSTYQDGSGQLVAKNNRTLPGWRDFERSVAAAFGGIAQESKAIFDVLLPIPDRDGAYYGVACKMRAMLRYVERVGRVTIEISNSAGQFWDALRTVGLDESNYEHAPAQVGQTLIHVVQGWHHRASIAGGGNVDLAGSFYLVLQWDKATGRYQLYQFPLALPDSETLQWSVVSRRLVGYDRDGTVIEWYGHSGGQLKYYPLAEKAKWISDCFRLEPLPATGVEYGILRKAADYFPEAWAKARQTP